MTDYIDTMIVPQEAVSAATSENMDDAERKRYIDLLEVKYLRGRIASLDHTIGAIVDRQIALDRQVKHLQIVIVQLEQDYLSFVHRLGVYSAIVVVIGAGIWWWLKR